MQKQLFTDLIECLTFMTKKVMAIIKDDVSMADERSALEGDDDAWMEDMTEENAIVQEGKEEEEYDEWNDEPVNLYDEARMMAEDFQMQEKKNAGQLGDLVLSSIVNYNSVRLFEQTKLYRDALAA